MIIIIIFLYLYHYHYQVPDSVEECLSGDMDACEGAIDAVEAALGIEVKTYKSKQFGVHNLFINVPASKN